MPATNKQTNKQTNDSGGIIAIAFLKALARLQESAGGPLLKPSRASDNNNRRSHDIMVCGDNNEKAAQRRYPKFYFLFRSRVGGACEI
jgi:hypothetical protein